MGVTTNIGISKYKTGLMYDAESVTLIGKYTDELAAYRARRQWVDTLGSYFLLENERDYEMVVDTKLDDDYFVVVCEFNSACGRYAFWRLINHQAPEAEQKLGGAIKNVGTKQTLGPDSDKPSWVINALSESSEHNEESTGLLDKIIRLFQ